MNKVSAGTFRVAAVLAPGDLARKLCDLGLRVGGLVSVLGNRGEDGLVIACGDARLALGEDAASKVRVVAVEEGV